MVKTAEELIAELKEGTLSTFWISRDEDVPWADKITIVTKKQENEIINLFIELLKSKKIIKVPKNKKVKGFCKKEADLSPGIYDSLEEQSKDEDFLVYAENNTYLGMAVLYPEPRSNHWDIYVNYLCSVEKGTGTKIMDMLKDAVKTNKTFGRINLSPLESAVEFYKKMGFKISHMYWHYYKTKNNIEEEKKVATGGYLKNGIRTLKLKHLKNAKSTSHNFTKKSSKFI